MKNPYTKTIALRLLIGLAKKVKQVREFLNCIQITYFANGGWCSTFISKKAFLTSNNEQRTEAAAAVEVTEVIDDETFVTYSHKSNSYYTVRPYSPIAAERCECADCYYRQTTCKHQIAVQQFLNQQFQLVVA